MSKVLVILRKLPGHEKVVSRVQALGENGASVGLIQEYVDAEKRRIVSSFAEFSEATFEGVIADISDPFL